MPGDAVLVVDDDARVAASLRRSLEYAGYRVSVAADGPVDGYGVCRALRADPATADPMVLMLTARDGIADRVTGLDAGADDYLVKPFEHDELLARVRALLRRRPAAAPPGPVVLGDLSLDPITRQVRRDTREIELTALEFQLLHHFLRHPRQVFTRQQLLDAVWGGGNAATSNVVDVYVGYLRTKLESGGEARLLHTVRGVGYALRE